MTCETGKKRYSDQLGANIAIANQQLKASRHRKNGKKQEIPLRSYRCPMCGGWHTTSQPKRNQNEGN